MDYVIYTDKSGTLIRMGWMFGKKGQGDPKPAAASEPNQNVAAIEAQIEGLQRLHDRERDPQKKRRLEAKLIEARQRLKKY